MINKRTGKPETPLEVCPGNINPLAVLNLLIGSKIAFFLNGECNGIAYEDIFKGTYYPAVSLYFNAGVELNFGPTFACPPKTDWEVCLLVFVSDKKYRPLCEVAGIEVEKWQKQEEQKEREKALVQELAKQAEAEKQPQIATGTSTEPTPATSVTEVIGATPKPSVVQTQAETQTSTDPITNSGRIFETS